MNLFERILSKDEITARFSRAVTAIISTGQCPNKATLADSLGVKPAKFSEILNGRMKVGLDMVARMCDLYSVSPDWLLMGRSNHLFRTTSLPKYWVDDCDLDAKLPDCTTVETNPIVSEPLSESLSAFLSLIKDKDREIGNLREDIGKLKARIEELERERPVPITPQYARSTSKETVET